MANCATTWASSAFFGLGFVDDLFAVLDFADDCLVADGFCAGLVALPSLLAFFIKVLLLHPEKPDGVAK